MEQEFERRHAEYIETCRADFRSKTDNALARYKQARDTLERKVRDLEAELKGAHEVRRGAERALAEADTRIRTLQGDVRRLEEESTAMVQQIVDIPRELQEAKDSKADASVLRRQRVQMFRGFSARVMAAAHRLGIHGLNLPTVLEDGGSSSASWLKSWTACRRGSWTSSTPSAGSSWGLQGRGSSPTFNASAPSWT
jgi:septal ring factor EnvC (AmiA/AmiB activator)